MENSAHGHRAAPPPDMSEIEGIVWPPVACITTPPLPFLLQQLEQLERTPAGEFAAGQQRQLAALSHYLNRHSAFHRRRVITAGLDTQQPLTLDTLCRLPPMSRRELQAGGSELYCAPPPSHEPVSETRTSGSSGEPVIVRRTAVNQLFWLAYGMREHLWWQRDFSGTLAVIRANLPRQRIDQANWGPPASLLVRTGPAHAFAISLDTKSLVELLSEVSPHYLLTYPNNLADLLRHFEQQKATLPQLKQIRSIGETLPDELRDRARCILGVDVVDQYSSQEVGAIAIQCPTSGLYHLMAENLIVEVLNEQGHPCATGETGQVVVTDLHNFATPLVRYAIGDHAEVGPSCSCGRSLPTLRRILGRSRNMVVFPDGTRHWPLVGFHRYREIAPIVQYQLVQHETHGIDVRLVTERPLTSGEEHALSAVIQEAIGYPFNISFTYFSDHIPAGHNGKFEEFICEVMPSVPLAPIHPKIPDPSDQQQTRGKR